MKIFLSYASENRSVAEKIAIGLNEDGHDVFYDRDDQQAGDEYNRRIREEIGRADLLLFLASPASLREGKYTLTELELFRARFPAPSGRVLTAIVERPAEELPPYLSANTFLEPRGNLVAEVLARVDEIDRRRRRRWWQWSAAGAAVVLAAATGIVVRLIPGPDRPGAREACHLRVAVRPSDPDGPRPLGLLFDVTHAGATRSFSAAGDGSAPIDVGPLTEASRTWTIAVKDAEGRVLGERTLGGCPNASSSVPIGERLELVVGPR